MKEKHNACLTHTNFQWKIEDENIIEFKRVFMLRYFLLFSDYIWIWPMVAARTLCIFSFIPFLLLLLYFGRGKYNATESGKLIMERWTRSKMHKHGKKAVEMITHHHVHNRTISQITSHRERKAIHSLTRLNIRCCCCCSFFVLRFVQICYLPIRSVPFVSTFSSI